MIARARLVVEADESGHSFIPVQRSSPPLLLRRAGPVIYLVGGAAGPIGGDDIELSVRVGEGARLTVRSVAAAVALPGRSGAWSRAHVEVHVARDASLDWELQPLISTTNGRHRATARVVLDAGARLSWRDHLVLGRHNELPGSVICGLNVESGNRPLLRQQLRLDSPIDRWSSPAVLDHASAVGSIIVVGHDTGRLDPDSWPARARVLELEREGVLVTTLGSRRDVARSLDLASVALADGEVTAAAPPRCSPTQS